MQDEIAKAEQDVVKFKKVQLHQELGHQVRERKQKDIADKQERKEKLATSGGPALEAEDLEDIAKKFKT